MALDQPNKPWGCENCKWIGPASALLTAPSPFDPSDTIVGCPQCKSVNEFRELCDEPGCQRTATSGWPSITQGYRRTCHVHSRIGKDEATP
jgi:hypothetical protein